MTAPEMTFEFLDGEAPASLSGLRYDASTKRLCYDGTPAIMWEVAVMRPSNTLFLFREKVVKGPPQTCMMRAIRRVPSATVADEHVAGIEMSNKVRRRVERERETYGTSTYAKGAKLNVPAGRTEKPSPATPPASSAALPKRRRKDSSTHQPAK